MTTDESLSIPAGQFAEVEATARELLPEREHLIVNGRIGGVHWFLALMREAAGLIRTRNKSKI